MLPLPSASPHLGAMFSTGALPGPKLTASEAFSSGSSGGGGLTLSLGGGAPGSSDSADSTPSPVV
jgi:hypothetical protein